jgi:DNA-binding CsgD family transcriptional regulator
LDWRVSFRTPGPLLERDRELTVLEQAAARATEGNGSVVLVEGPAGVGKTRLLREAAARAEATGLRVLSATGGEVEQELGWGIVRRLFASTIESGELQWSGAARLALPIFNDARLPSDASLGAMLHGLHWMAAQLADKGPLLVVVDDAQWADAPSLRWLAYLTARLEGVRALIAIAIRSGEASGAGELLDVIAARAQTALITVPPLSREASGVLVVSELGTADEEFQTACFDATRGSPLLLHAVLDELRDRPDVAPAEVTELRPERVTRWVRRRLIALSPQAQALAPAVAVAGLSPSLRLAGELGGLGQDEAARAADELAQARLLELGLPLRFAHPLVRRVIYELLPPVKRATAHAAAATLLREAGARPSEIAVHLLHVEPRADPTVVETLLAAAEEALARGDPDTASSVMRRGLNEPPTATQRGEVLRRLGLARTALLDRDGFAHLEAAIEATADPSARGRIALELSRCLRVAADFPRAVRPLERALAELPPDSPLAERVEGELINICMFDPGLAPRASARLRRFRDPDALARLDAPGLLADLALMSVSRGARNDAVSLARRALAGLSPDAPDPSVVIFALKALGGCDELEEARAGWSELIERARERDLQDVSAFGCCFRSEVNLWAGSVADAEADALDATEAFARWGARALEPVSMLIQAQVERGSEPEAQQWLDRVAPQELPALWDAAVLLCARARLRLAQGRAQEAANDALDAGRVLAPYATRGVHVAPTLVPWRSTAAIALAAQERLEEARELASEELELARRLGARRAIGVALRAMALAQTGQHRLGAANESVSVLAASPARLEHARAICTLGTALRQAGRRVEAREHLRDALDLAVRCGGLALASEARAELQLAGSRPRRDRISGRDALTAGELRVARLAAEGHTNREIAQSLFLTARTVETHLTHAYDKLGVTSRRQLPDKIQLNAPGAAVRPGPATKTTESINPDARPAS